MQRPCIERGGITHAFAGPQDRLLRPAEVAAQLRSPVSPSAIRAPSATEASYTTAAQRVGTPASARGLQ